MIVPGPLQPTPQVEQSAQENLYFSPTKSVVPLKLTSISSTQVDLFTVQPDEFWEITSLTVYNRNAVTTPSLTMNIVPDGGSISTANECYFDSSITARASEKLDVLIGTVLKGGDTLSVTTSDAGVLTFYGAITRYFTGERSN